MHAAVTTAKKDNLNHREVINCRVIGGDVIGDLAKSQAVRRTTRERFEEKSEGGNSTTHSQFGYLSRAEARVGSVLDTSCRR